jgi:hypothetical protein
MSYAIGKVVVTSKCKSHALYNMTALHASIKSDKEIGTLCVECGKWYRTASIKVQRRLDRVEL